MFVIVCIGSIMGSLYLSVPCLVICNNNDNMRQQYHFMVKMTKQYSYKLLTCNLLVVWYLQSLNVKIITDIRPTLTFSKVFFAGLTYMQLLLSTWPIVKYQLYFQPEKLAESFLYFCQGMGVGKKHLLFLALMLFKFLRKKKEPSW